MEHYSDIGEELRVNVCRVFVLRMANLAALIFSFHHKIQAVRQPNSVALVVYVSPFVSPCVSVVVSVVVLLCLCGCVFVRV